MNISFVFTALDRLAILFTFELPSDTGQVLLFMIRIRVLSRSAGRSFRRTVSKKF